MPQQQDLELLRPLRSAQQHHQLKQPAQAPNRRTTSPRTTSEVGEGANLPTYELTPLAEHELSI
jgi:hypothetical protein